METGKVSDHSVIFLANLPATSKQRRLIFLVAIFLLIAFATAAPFADLPARRFDSFIPSIAAIIFVNDLVTSVLLFAQYSIVPSRAILVLAGGYLFSALIVIPHSLTFPGAFTPTGLLGAGFQSTGWLYFFWHIGSPIAVLAYACLKDEISPDHIRQRSTAPAIGWSVAIVTGLICGFTWTATAGEWFLPRFFSDSTRHIQSSLYIFIPSILMVSAVAFAFLWMRRRSALDYWLMLVVYTLVLEVVLIAWFSSARFSFGFYAGRVFSLITSTIVLVLLLAETTKLYARLARSYRLLENERDSKLMNVEAVTASIAHEIRQPLTAIASSGNAARRFLDGAAPDLQKVRTLLDRMTSESYRASEIFESIRALFRVVNRDRQLVDLNEIVLEVLGSFREELRDHSVTTRTALTAELPAVEGDRSQLRQVFLNLVRNSLEAMGSIQDRSRMLLVRTELRETNAIRVAIEDSGPGINPNQLDTIFDAFVTTKSYGMGLGLAICRTIIEKHGGELSARSDGKQGAQFQFILPIHSSN